MVQSLTNDNEKLSDKVRFQPLNFASIYRPVYYLSRFFGLMPFSMTLNSNGDIHEPKVTAFDCLWFIISIGIYIVCAIIAFGNIIHSTRADLESSLHLIILADHLLLIVGLLIGAFIIAMDMFNRFKIVNILKLFNSFDREVRDFFFIWIVLMTGVLMSVISFVTTYIFYDIFYQFSIFELLHFYCPYIFQYNVTFLTSISYIILLTNLQKRFAALNSFLRFNNYAMKFRM